MTRWGTALSRSATTRSGAPPARRSSTRSCCWHRGTSSRATSRPGSVCATSHGQWNPRRGDRAGVRAILSSGCVAGMPLTPGTTCTSNRRSGTSALHSKPEDCRMSRCPRGGRYFAAGTIAVALLAACTNTQSPNAVLSQLEANAVAEEITTDAAGIAQGATYNSSGAPFALAPMTGAPVMPAASGTCTPTVTPASPTNSDGDPVPDSVNVDFTGCTVTSGSYTATLGGTIDYVDPTPTVPDRALRTRHNDFSRSVTNTVTGKTRSAVENGVRMVSGNADQLQFTETDFRTDYTFATGATASHV